jgi:Flp pilus assembly protein TadG
MPKPALRCRPQSFVADSRGTIAIIFSLSFLALSVAIGLAVDSSRAYNVSTRVQNALDAAALAGAKLIDEDGITAAEIHDEAQRYFETQIASASADGLRLSNFRTNVNLQTNTVEALVDVSMPTIFGALAGASETIDFVKSSTASYKATKIEVALVVDITGSMCDVPPAVTDPPCTTAVKLDALKSAANDMVDALFEADPRVGAVRVALVPYAASVNAGPYAVAVSAGTSTDGCVVERSGPNAYTNAFPSPAHRLGVSDTATRWYYSCVATPVMPLADLSSGPTRAAFKAAINSLAASGGTAGHLGTAWGWYMLSPEWGTLWPASAPRPYDSAQVIKAIVLMTDGMFNVAYDNGGEIYPWPNPSATDPSLIGTSPNQALALCEAMRNPADVQRRIRIYTVAFQAPPQSEALLKQCSGEANYYDTTTASQLSAAFKDIVKKLTNLRVTS